jgi:hypothetical protein
MGLRKPEAGRIAREAETRSGQRPDRPRPTGKARSVRPSMRMVMVRPSGSTGTEGEIRSGAIRAKSPSGGSGLCSDALDAVTLDAVTLDGHHACRFGCRTDSRADTILRPTVCRSIGDAGRRRKTSACCAAFTSGRSSVAGAARTWKGDGVPADRAPLIRISRGPDIPVPSCRPRRLFDAEPNAIFDRIDMEVFLVADPLDNPSVRRVVGRPALR